MEQVMVAEPLGSITDEQIAEWQRRILEDQTNELAAILRRGETYLEIKRAVKHSKFLAMFEDRDGPLPTTSSTARRYARIAENEVLKKHASSRVLPSSCSALYELTKVNSDVLEEWIGTGKVHSAMTAEDAVMLREGRDIKPKPNPRDEKDVILRAVPNVLLELRTALFKAGARGMNVDEFAKRIIEDLDVTTRSRIFDPRALEQFSENLEYCQKLVAALQEARKRWEEAKTCH